MSNLLGVSEAASLAMHTMALLARSPHHRSSNGELARALHASEHTLAKVLQRLVRAGLLQSLRGPNGGFVLGRSADEISLLEVFEAVEGPVAPMHCLLGVPVCAGRPCVLGELAQTVNRQVIDRLSQTTLAELSASVRL